MNDISTTPERAPASRSASAAPQEQVSGFERALNALRLALHLGERFLPQPYGNLASTAQSLLKPSPPAPHPPHTVPHTVPPAAPPDPPVDLTPIVDGLTVLQAEHRELCGQVQEQSASLKRVGEQLEQVSEASARNTLAQQGLMDTLKGVEKRMKELKTAGERTRRIAWIALGVLVFFVSLSALLLWRFRRILF